MKTIKFFAFLITLCCFFLCTLPLYPLLFFIPYLTRKILTRIVSTSSWILLLILNIKVEFEAVKDDQNYLIVSNHLSYLDVLILASKYPSCFVTSKEVKNTFFLGQISSLAGCLFVDRKDKRHLKDEISELREALSNGLNVTVFPEATSTNGDEVLRFRRPLFESSLATGIAILPLTINYLSISGKPVTTLNRDKVCWYGDMDFFPHFLELLNEKKIQVKVSVGEPMRPELMTTIDLAFKSHQTVSRSFQPLNKEVMEAL
jgi:1-acyl-sn-glycerol-3-phosphate acyltransferase